MELLIPRVDDFAVTGDGSNAAWSATEWVPLVRVGDGPATYATRAKVLYSATGMYFLVDSEDRQLTCTLTEHNSDLYVEDVVEVFLWSNEEQDLYFEYEISPLNYELPILIPNNKGKFFGWLPWHYTGERKTRTATTVRGGEKASMAKVEGWTAEFFLPFALMLGMGNVPPTPGMSWRGNIYRLDYDSGKASHYTWCPDTNTNFHAFHKFGTLTFG